MVERIRDATVAEAIAAEAGTDATPELVLLEGVRPVILLQQRPPLASSGYFPGTIGVTAPAVTANRSHVGIFGSAVGRAIVRVNWAMIMNDTAQVHSYTLRRLQSPFTGFPSVRAVPGYISAGPISTGGVFSLTKTDTVAAQGILMATFIIEAQSQLFIPGPWIINDGGLLLVNNTVDLAMAGAFGYEHWPSIRPQPSG